MPPAVQACARVQPYCPGRFQLWAPQTVLSPRVSCQCPALSPPSPGTFSCTELLEHVHSRASVAFLSEAVCGQPDTPIPPQPKALQPQCWGIPVPLTECWEYKRSSFPAPLQTDNSCDAQRPLQSLWDSLLLWHCLLGFLPSQSHSPGMVFPGIPS